MAVMRHDTGGVAFLSAVALDKAPGVLIKTGQGLLYGWHIKNTTGAAQYIQLFDKAALSGVTIGTTVPDLTIGLPANGSNAVSFQVPVNFINGLCAFSTTTAGGSTDAVSDCVFFYV